jgi:uncharacterized repeat protein (TIGR03803 family)
MKTRLLLPFACLFVISLLFMLSVNSAQAQTPAFWGMTNGGGTDNAGTIFKMEPDGTGLTLQQTFTFQNPGSRPYFGAQLTQLSNGKLYGVTLSGGLNNVGVLFEYDATTNVYTRKIDFSTATGSVPMGRLSLASNGKLYGLATSGGANNLGVIFEYDPTTNVYTKKIDLAITTGAVPQGNSLYLHTNGKFYGMTLAGGANNLGVLFEYDPTTNAYTKKIDFAGSANGANPYGSLMITSGGKVFGLTSNGGANGLGTLFEYTPTTNTLTKKVDFTAANGAYPFCDLTEASNNRLYGVTPTNGSIFEYNPATNAFAKKIDLGANNAPFAYGTLVKGSNGKLYGMSSGGGISSEGLLFEYDASTNTFTKKIDFTLATGLLPYGGLLLASNGNFYGLMSQGGIADNGVLFEYNASTNTYTKKVDLSTSLFGSYPQGGLMRASNNKLYGMAKDGGANNEGVIFEIDPITNTFTKKYDFVETSGSFPQGDLAQALNGKLYGLTSEGGATGDGTIFEFDPISGVYTKKHDFDETNGSEPFGSLVLASNNKLYGATSSGGAEGYGVIFEYDPATNLFTKKADFDYLTTGYGSYDRLIQATNGKLYGLTRDGGFNGNSLGTLFEYDISSNAITAKVSLIGANGETPEGGLTQAPNGKLYGLTRFGGTNGVGALFEYDITANTFITKFNFSGSTVTGFDPKGSLALSPNGKLYGATSSGGATGRGTIFEYDPANGTVTKKQDFTGANGAGFLYSRLLLVKGEQTISFASLPDKTVGDAAFALTASSSVILPITYTSSNTTVATVSGNTVTIVGAGTTTITASQAGDDSYNAASNVAQTLTVNKLSQTISFAALAAKNFGEAAFTLTATTTSGLPISFASSNTAVATISGNTVTIVEGGTTTITASQEGDASYNAAPNVTQTLTVNKINQTVTFAAISDKTVGDAPFALSASATSTLPVSFSTSSNKIILSGSQVTIVSAGRATITAAQAGNVNYNIATSAERSFCIKPAKPTITVSGLNTEAPVLTSSAATGNQWFRNDILISGATNTTLVATQEGVYEVQVTVDDCVSDFSTTQTLIVTGAEENAANAISVYPNPSHDWLTISLGELQGAKEILVVDSNGRTMDSKKEIGTETKLYIAAYPIGVYLVNVKTQRSTHTIRFVKK